MSAKSLYTQTLPKDLGQTVKAIPAAEDCDTFQSRPTSYDEGDNQWMQWVEAWKDPRSKLWTLEMHQRFVGSDDTSRRQKTVAKNVSFFDALHYCAFEEVSRTSGGAQISAEIDEDVHYTTIAVNAHQPLDSQGLPHPAAYGRILTDGIFDDSAYEMAKKTRGVALDENANMAAPSLIDFDSIGIGDVTNGNAVRDATDKVLRKQGLIKKFDEALDAADTLRNIKASRRNESYAKDTLRAITPTIFNWEDEYIQIVHALGYVGMGLCVSAGALIVLAEGLSLGLITSTIIPKFRL